MKKMRGRKKMNNFFRSSPSVLLLLSLFLLLIIFITPGYSENLNNGNSLPGTESILSAATWTSNQETPAVWEDRVVWADRREHIENSSYYQSDIYLYNITTGVEERITSTTNDELSPDIWDNYLVWEEQDQTEGDTEIFLYNLTSHAKTRLTNDTRYQHYPKIWGDSVVWQDGDEGFDSEFGIYLYDIKTGTTKKISSNTSYALHPAIWEDRIVWEDGRNGVDLNIFLYNITVDSEYQVTTDSNYQTYPSIWGDRIVWEDNRDGPSQIYAYDVVNETESRITETNFSCSRPIIFKDYIVYLNQREYYEVSLIDLRNQTDQVISRGDPSSFRSSQDLWENRVVWEDSRIGNSDIFLYTIGISMPDLIPGFSANTTQGISPLSVAFTDNTSGQVDRWQWDFGDGTKTEEQNPLHNYESDGSYTVILTVNNPFQRNATRIVDFISVGSVPVPQFSQDVSSGPAPLFVQFTDTSSGQPTRWFWEFGDENTSTEQNPGHVFFQPGIYQVNLTVSNIFGNTSLSSEDLITVVEGTFTDLILPSDGFEINTSDTSPVMGLNVHQAGNATVLLRENGSIVEYQPAAGSGIAQILLFSQEGGQFSYISNDTITGLLGSVDVTSENICPRNFSQIPGENCSFNFTFTMSDYSPGGTLHLVTWEGCTPTDLQRFNAIKTLYNYAILEGLAYTVQFDNGTISNSAPTNLTFGVGSDWVSTYGWGDNRTLEIRSIPDNATVYVDGNYVGISPIDVSNLAPGSHEVRLSKTGYQIYTTTLIVADERDSIHVIRIGDNGSGEVLNTTFIGHDPVRNLDFFRAESPHGLSTFGLASLSKSGNIFQIIKLVAAATVRSSSGGGGVGSGSGSNWISTNTTAKISVPTPSPTPTALIESTGNIEPVLTSSTPVTMVTEEPTTQATEGTFPGLLEEASALIILKNLSIVFVVIFMTIIFYLRWKRKEE
jgi:beta propeller repeat protein